MMYAEIMALCSEIHTEQMNKLRWQKVELFKVNYRSTQINHRFFKRLIVRPNSTEVPDILSAFEDTGCMFLASHRCVMQPSYIVFEGKKVNERLIIIIFIYRSVYFTTLLVPQSSIRLL